MGFLLDVLHITGRVTTHDQEEPQMWVEGVQGRAAEAIATNYVLRAIKSHAVADFRGIARESQLIQAFAYLDAPVKLAVLPFSWMDELKDVLRVSALGDGLGYASVMSYRGGQVMFHEVGGFAFSTDRVEVLTPNPLLFACNRVDCPLALSVRVFGEVIALE
jgi:hypothetical protein